MISAESRGDKYLIKFKGKKHQFNEYINKIMSLTDKQWDLKERSWIVPKHSLNIIQTMFKNIEFLDEVNNELINQKIKDYENMGKNMKLQPYDYQKEAIKFGIDNYNILIVYPCGSGKTPIGIGLYLEAREHGIINGPGMIVVKASLKTQWVKEVQKFSDFKATIIQTPSESTESIRSKIKRRQNKIKNLDKVNDKCIIQSLKDEINELKEEQDNVFKDQFNNNDLYILNYETLRNEQVRTEIHRRKIQFIFSDEIHYIKSHEAERSKALYEFGATKMKIGATATPITKDPRDAFGIFKFINPSLFKDFSSFARMYIKYAGFGRISGFKNTDHLRKKIAPYIIVKSKEEISDQLPDLVVIQRYCDMTVSQSDSTTKIMGRLDALKEEEAQIRSKCRSEKDVKDNPHILQIEAMILALQTFAQEIADAPQLLIESPSEMAKDYVCESQRSPKLDLVAELVEEIISSGEKVCIFSKFEKMQRIITERIKSIPDIGKSINIAYVNGSLNDKKRYTEVYDKFRDDDSYKVLLMTDAGAEGLNLSKCRYIIEYDLAESYTIQTQRHGRIERSDSIHDNVFVYQLIANDSWDIIQQKIVSKKESYDADLIKSLVNKDFPI